MKLLNAEKIHCYCAFLLGYCVILMMLDSTSAIRSSSAASATAPTSTKTSPLHTDIVTATTNVPSRQPPDGKRIACVIIALRDGKNKQMNCLRATVLNYCTT